MPWLLGVGRPGRAQKGRAQECQVCRESFAKDVVFEDKNLDVNLDVNL